VIWCNDLSLSNFPQKIHLQEHNVCRECWAKYLHVKREQQKNESFPCLAADATSRLVLKRSERAAARQLSKSKYHTTISEKLTLRYDMLLCTRQLKGILDSDGVPTIIAHRVRLSSTPRTKVGLI
jgi:hypothetical protein